MKTVRVGTGKNPALFLVVAPDGRVHGQLEKYRGTRGTIHPWKAYAGTGVSRRYLGAFYGENGGKAAALEAVLAHPPVTVCPDCGQAEGVHLKGCGTDYWAPPLPGDIK